MLSLWNETVNEDLIDIFQDLIKLKTINADNNEIIAAKYIEELLLKEGIESQIIESAPGRGNIISKLEGGNESPIIFISHLDVVDVDTSKWTHDPFEAQIENGIIYGRGTLDTKQLTAMGLISMLLLKRNNVKLNRDIIFIATADEENGSNYGMKYLVDNYPNLIPKGYVINEGGGFVLDYDDIQFRTCACGEKGVCEIKVYIEQDDNLLLNIAKLTEKVTSYKSEEFLCEVSSKYEELAHDYLEKDITIKNLWEYMIYNTFTINKFNIDFENMDKTKPLEMMLTFRYIPNITKIEVQKTIDSILQSAGFKYEIVSFRSGYQSDINNDFIKILADKSEEYGTPSTLLPMLALGNTDGRFIQHNVYGYSPLLKDIPFSEVIKKVHSHNECITVDSLIYGSKVLLGTILEMLEYN